MFLFCSYGVCRRSWHAKREQDAVPDNGIAVERREAPGPTLLGPRARKRQPLVTGDLPWRAPNPGFGFGTRGDPRAGASRRSIPLWGKRKKGNGGPAWPPEFKARVREVMSESVGWGTRDPCTRICQQPEWCTPFPIARRADAIPVEVQREGEPDRPAVYDRDGWHRHSGREDASDQRGLALRRSSPAPDPSGRGYAPRIVVEQLLLVGIREIELIEQPQARGRVPARIVGAVHHVVDAVIVDGELHSHRTAARPYPCTSCADTSLTGRGSLAALVFLSMRPDWYGSAPPVCESTALRPRGISPSSRTAPAATRQRSPR